MGVAAGLQGSGTAEGPTPSGEEVDLSVSLDQADLGTPVSALGLSTRARNALERAERPHRARSAAVSHQRHPPDAGVGNQTRQEIIRFVGELRERFPNIEAIRPKDQPPSKR